MIGLSKTSKVIEIFERIDENRVKRYSVREEEIYERGITNSLEKKIERLNQQIASIPTKIVYPDNATDEIKILIDERNAIIPDITELEAEKAKLETLLAKTQEVK